MLTFIKKLFKKEELPKKEVPLAGLRDYFDACVKERLGQIEQELKPLHESISTCLDKAKLHIDSLATAALQNDKVFPKERQVMEGNRESYVRATTQFLEKIKEKELTPHTAESYVQSFHETLEVYKQGTAKNYAILQEFFAHESRSVVEAIKELQARVSSIADLLNQMRTTDMMKIHMLIEKINNRLAAVHEFDSDIKTKESSIAALEHQKKEFTQKIQALEKSKEIQEFKELEQKRQHLLVDMERLKQGFYQWFSSLQHPLKKYAKQSTDESLILLYEQDPVQALMQDSSLKILDIFAKLKQAIDANTIDLKDTKRDKASEALQVLNKKYLEKFIKEYKPQRDQKLDVDHSLRTHKRMQEYNELKYRLEHFDEKIALIHKEILALKEQQAKKASIDDIKEELLTAFRTVFGVELVIQGPSGTPQ